MKKRKEISNIKIEVETSVPVQVPVLVPVQAPVVAPPVIKTEIKLDELDVANYRLIQSQYLVVEKAIENVEDKTEILRQKKENLDTKIEVMQYKKDFLSVEKRTITESYQELKKDLSAKYSINFDEYMMDLVNCRLLRKKV